MIVLPMDNGHLNGNCHPISNDYHDCRLKSRSSNSLSIPSPSPASLGVNYIEHCVSKMDTLAGIAIKYGVEVADIKRLNGLVTDLQMFAHKSLRIPLPGRHPPSPISSNASAREETGSAHLRTPPRYPRRDLYKDFKSLKSPQRNVSAAMSNLQGYYGLASPLRNGSNGDGSQLTVYKNNSSQLSADGTLPWAASEGDDYLEKNRSSRRTENGFRTENGEVRDIDSERSAEKSVRRRQKADTDLSPQPSEHILKDESSGGLLARTGKGLALRPKSASKTNLTDMDAATDRRANPSNCSILPDVYAAVRRSSSTPNIHDSLGGYALSWSASKWTLKPDLQVLSAVAIPILDGLPMPIKRNKTAMD